MCGIAGIFSSMSCSNISEETVSNILATMHNRGPDASSCIRTEKAVFLHSRLKIQDLDEHANQPWTSGNWILVFNGEIYNFKEIRDTLSENFTFKTECDTEVLMNLFLHHECDIGKTLKDLNGMFAFAFYNKENHTMVIARDRLGIKPLFYYHDTDTFAFASNINSLMRSCVFEPMVSTRSLSSYLSFRAPLYTDTMYENITQLAPGHYMEINTSASIASLTEYWDVPVSEPHPEEICDVRLLVQECVHRRMVSDVPLCTYLSGGVDSSAITAFTQMASANRIHSYTIGFPELNEFPYARIVSERYKTQHSEQTVDYSTYFETMVDLIYEKGEPLGVPNEVPLYLMSRKLKNDGFTVVLSGEGADEIFQGYGRIFQLGHDYSRLKKFEDGDVRYAAFKEHYKNAATETFHDFFVNRYSYVSLDKKRDLFVDECSDVHINSRFESVFSKVSHLDARAQISYAMLKLHLPTLLRRFDNSTMATSVEGRVPFVDHRLVEKIFPISSDQKIPWKTAASRTDADELLSSAISEVHDVPKAILKNALREDLPDEILFRRKVGFPVPLKDWFSGKFNAQIRTIVSRLAGRNIFKREKLMEIVDNFGANSSNSDTYLIWGFINIEIWYSLFIEKLSKEDILSDLYCE